MAAAQSKSCKAMVEIDGRTMIEHVIAALEESGRISKIVLCMGAGVPVAREAPALAARIARGELACRVPAESPSLSVVEALASLEPGTPLLVTTADHPLLTPQLVRQFLDAAAQSGADLAGGLAPLHIVNAAYPRARRTRLKFRDGSYSGCNLFAFMGADAHRVARFWRQVEKHRKRPLRLLSNLGPFTLAAYALGLLTLPQVLARLGRRVGAKLQHIVLHSAEAATDVDSVADLELVQRIMAGRVKRPAQAAAAQPEIPAVADALLLEKAAAG